MPLQAPFDVEKVCELLGKLVDAVKAGAKHQARPEAEKHQELKVELCDVKVELRDLKQVVLASVRNVAEPQAPCVEGVFQTPSAEAVKAGAQHQVRSTRPSLALRASFYSLRKRSFNSLVGLWASVPGPFGTSLGLRPSLHGQVRRPIIEPKWALSVKYRPSADTSRHKFFLNCFYLY